VAQIDGSLTKAIGAAYVHKSSVLQGMGYQHEAAVCLMEGAQQTGDKVLIEKAGNALKNVWDYDCWGSNDYERTNSEDIPVAADEGGRHPGFAVSPQDGGGADDELEEVKATFAGQASLVFTTSAYDHHGEVVEATPLLSATECAYLVDAAEQEAQARRRRKTAHRPLRSSPLEAGANGIVNGIAAPLTAAGAGHGQGDEYGGVKQGSKDGNHEDDQQQDDQQQDDQQQDDQQQDDGILSGWSTRRHVSYPTTDIPVNEILGGTLLPWFNQLLRTRLLPWAAAWFPSMAPDAGEDAVRADGCSGCDYSSGRGASSGKMRKMEPEDLYVYDAFVARYDASGALQGARASLPLHRDKSLISFTVGLNAKSNFEAGGTYFSHLNRAVSADVGDAVVFAGGVEHAGAAITAGTRYVLVLFVHVKGHQSCSAGSLFIPVGLTAPKARPDAPDAPDAPAHGS
jgi:hypothetical protein